MTSIIGCGGGKGRAHEEGGCKEFLGVSKAAANDGLLWEMETEKADARLISSQDGEE